MLFKRTLTIPLVVLLSIQPLAAASPETIRTDWNGLQQQISQRKLGKRNVWISTNAGDRIKATLIATTAAGLIVRANRHTAQWSSKDGEATVPREVIQSVQFTGKIGKGGLIGALAGLGAGVGLTAAAANADSGCEGQACTGLLLLLPAGAVAGYFIGRAASQPAPIFVLQPAAAPAAEE